MFAMGPEGWHFNLGGKVHVEASLSPQEVPRLSSNVKYIGLDVHKEACDCCFE